MNEKFARFLEEKGCRKTPERFAILKEILNIDKHFDVEMLRDKMSGSQYNVSKTTIYSNLELLVECGIVQRQVFTNRAVYERVDGKMQHIHLVCNLCGKIKDVKDVELIRYLNTKKFSAFNSEHFALTVYGTCNNCARKSKKHRKMPDVNVTEPVKLSTKGSADVAAKVVKKK
ncbi:MAG: Fur family transcriptional regulator [Muribaculaceae bacterium]